MTMDQMIEDLNLFCLVHKLEPMSADELLIEHMDTLNAEAKAFLKNYIIQWEELEDELYS
jgi:hypothetical protein